MSPTYILPPLSHKEGVVARPEFGRPVERRNEVPRDHAGCRPISPHSPSWVREGNTGLFDRQTGNCSPGDLFHGPLKELWEEDVPHHIRYPLEGNPYVRGNVLYEGPLLRATPAKVSTGSC